MIAFLQFRKESILEDAGCGWEGEMEKPELWHVFVDDGTRKRSCYFGLWDALALNDAGEFVPVCQGRTEIPFEEWTCGELCWIISGCLKEAKMGRLASLPKIILRTMEKCGVGEDKKLDVMRNILKEIWHKNKAGTE